MVTAEIGWPGAPLSIRALNLAGQYEIHRLRPVDQMSNIRHSEKQIPLASQELSVSRFAMNFPLDLPSGISGNRRGNLWGAMSSEFRPNAISWCRVRAARMRGTLCFRTRYRDISRSPQTTTMLLQHGSFWVSSSKAMGRLGRRNPT